jgi:hypothetical protein
LTSAFLKLGFAPHTHATNPQLIQDSKEANNANDMQVVCYYYAAHDWLEDVSEFSSNNNYRILLLHGVHDGIVPIQYGQVVANQLDTELTALSLTDAMIRTAPAANTNWKP